MEYKLINLDTWERGKLFRFFIDNLRNVMSMTVDIDVTPLKEFIKAQGCLLSQTLLNFDNVPYRLNNESEILSSRQKIQLPT